MCSGGGRRDSILIEHETKKIECSMLDYIAPVAEPDRQAVQYWKELQREFMRLKQMEKRKERDTYWGKLKKDYWNDKK